MRILLILMALIVLAGCGGGSTSDQPDPGWVTVTPLAVGGGMTLGVLKDASGVPQGVRVTWQRVTDSTATGYWVYRADNSTDMPDGDPAGLSSYRANATLIAQPSSGTTVIFDDTTFTPVIGEDYYYRVTVVNTTNDESDFSNQLGITIATHTISGVTTSGVSIGDQVTITGTHFGTTQGSDKVYFTDADGTTDVEAASYVSWGSEQIIVTVPYGAADGIVGVEIGGSAVYSSQNIDYNEPVISGQPNPSEDWIQNLTITLSGSDFGPAPGSGGTESAVYFGTTPNQSSDIVSWTNTEIQLKVPAAATGMTVTVHVDVAGNESNDVNFTLLPHVDVMSANSGIVGASVTLTGTNFGVTQSSGNVTINGTAVGITSWSNTSIVFTVPSTGTDGSLLLTRSDAESTSPGGFDIIPVVNSFNFTRRETGESLAISGYGFGGTQGTSSVTFNGGSVDVATYNSWSAVAVEVIVPSGATRGTVTVTVDDDDTGGMTQDSATSAGEVVIILPPPVIDDVGQL